MTPASVKIEVRTPDFFRLPPKKITVEEEPATGRVYFIHADRIVAVGRPTQ